jgi:hypothetical protein
MIVVEDVMAGTLRYDEERSDHKQEEVIEEGEGIEHLVDRWP